MTENFIEFKSLIDNYKTIKSLAEKYDVNPEKIIGFFLQIGTEVLSRSNDLMINEFKDRLEKYLKKNKSVLSLTDFKKAHDYFKKNFQKNNEVKND